MIVHYVGRRILLALAVGGCLLFGGNPPARAGFVIQIQATVGGNPYLADITDNGPLDLDPTPGSIFYSTPSFANAFAISALMSVTNSPGDPLTGGELDLSTFGITNTSHAVQTIQVWITSTGFTAPGGANSQISVSSAIGGSFTFGPSGGTDTYVYRATADQSASGGVEFGTGISLSPSSLTFTASAPPKTASFSGDQEGLFTRLPSDPSYSLSSFSTITLAPGSRVGFNGTITTSDPDPPEAPEPGGLVLLLTGLPQLGLVGWLRHRRRRLAPSGAN